MDLKDILWAVLTNERWVPLKLAPMAGNAAASNVPIRETQRSLPTFKNQVEDVDHGPQQPFVEWTESPMPKEGTEGQKSEVEEQEETKPDSMA